MKYFIAIVVILALITLINILLESHKENRTISFSNYRIHDKRIRKDIRIVMISDLHNAQFGDHNKDLIKKIDLIKPDMIISAGDMIVGKPGKTVDIASELLNDLGRKYPVYIGKGNHEMRTSIYPQYGDMWERLYNNTKDNVTWLINDSIYLEKYNLKIYGLDMKPEFYRRFKKLYMPDSYIAGEIGKADDKAYNILIGHDPDYFDSNGPFRGHKRDLYEGGIRTPFVVQWPGVIPAGVITDHISAFWDFLPTISDLLQTKSPQGINGISYLPTLTGKGKQKKHDYIYYEFFEAGGKQSIMDLDGWKLIRLEVSTPAKTYEELYNIYRDPAETTNVIRQYPEIAKKLKEKIESQRTENSHFHF